MHLERSSGHLARAGGLGKELRPDGEREQVHVHRRATANKTEIKIAVQKVFDVNVAAVNTFNRKGKRKRTRSGWGKRKDIKRAVVTLAEATRIESLGGPVS